MENDALWSRKHWLGQFDQYRDMLKTKRASGIDTVGSDSVTLIHAYVVLTCVSTGV
jgi:hypothetical protein